MLKNLNYSMNQNGNEKLICTKVYILLKSVSDANFYIMSV